MMLKRWQYGVIILPQCPLISNGPQLKESILCKLLKMTGMSINLSQECKTEELK
jgi:hypothetical protein